MSYITPAWDGKMNGFEVNPINYTHNGFDSRIYGNISFYLLLFLPLLGYNVLFLNRIFCFTGTITALESNWRYINSESY